MNGVSVIICAHNSAQRLQPTLEALARCRSEFPVEVIVVDNNSTDATAARAAEIRKTLGNKRFDFLVIDEPQPGLAYARRAGIKAASGNVLVFCDDDNWLAEDYLLHAMRLMRDPNVGAAGGCSVPTNPQRLPPWFYSFSWGYAVGVPLERIDELPEFPERECTVPSLWGAGLVVRREPVEYLFSLSGFPALTGRKGASLLSGDDLEISACLLFAGYKLVFSRALTFEHDIAPERLESRYAKTLFNNFASGFSTLGHYHKIIEAFETPQRAALVGTGRILKHVLTGRLSRNSFVSLLAAFRLKSLLTHDQQRIYGNVQSIRSRYRRPHTTERRKMTDLVAGKPA